MVGWFRDVIYCLVYCSIATCCSGWWCCLVALLLKCAVAGCIGGAILGGGCIDG